MSKLFTVLSFLLLVLNVSWAQKALFIPNEGQWEKEFSHKTPLKYGALFFKENSIQFVLKDAAQIDDLHGHDIHQAWLSHSIERLNVHVLNMEFIDSRKDNAIGYNKASFKHNYFTGDDQTKWRSGIEPARALQYQGLYPNAVLHFKTKNHRLKYEWRLNNSKTIPSIKWKYHGAESIEINNEGNLIVNTSVGHFYESKPVAWGWKKGERIDFGIWYELNNDTISFGVENIALTLDSVVLDPQLIFTSFSGSLTDNWGFTATYDDQGRLYGGGIAFATGYVSTVGAFQTGYNSSTGPFQNFEPDVTISVFEPNGNNLLYASYLGGSKSDHPHSMVVNSN